MISETYSAVEARSQREVWPPDDTDESVIVTVLQQTTIINVRLGINETATMRTPPGGVAPWQALSQTLITGFRRPDGSRYKTMPDVFVYPRPIGKRRGSVSLGADGPPLLIVEVLSESTYETDLDMEAGKGYSYAKAGVAEYMTLDPTGEFLREGVRAWRLDGDLYRPWLPGADGRWRRGEIAVALALEGAQATVYTLDGMRHLREGEIAQELAYRDAALADKDVELAQRDATLAELRSRLAELGEPI